MAKLLNYGCPGDVGEDSILGQLSFCTFALYPFLYVLLASTPWLFAKLGMPGIDVTAVFGWVIPLLAVILGSMGIVQNFRSQCTPNHNIKVFLYDLLTFRRERFGLAGVAGGILIVLAQLWINSFFS